MLNFHVRWTTQRFDLTNVGRTHAQDEANIIRRRIIQKREGLEQIKGEPVGAKLLEEKESIKEDFIHFETALSPHKLISKEILGEIFILLALDYGPVELPIRRSQTPPPTYFVPRVFTLADSRTLYT